MAKHRNAERDRAIGARICVARILHGATRPALGGRVGVAARQIARYEGGRAPVPASLLQDLGAALDCAPASFLETDPRAIARVEVLALPKEGSVARRHLDRAFAVLGVDPKPGGSGPFGDAAPAAQRGSEAA